MSTGPAPGTERVRCTGCDFRWYGLISAHGLAVLGHCPRCSGELEFTGDHAEDDAAAVDRAADEAGLQPWEVLGTPVSWST